MTRNTDEEVLTVPFGCIEPGTVIEFAVSTRRHDAGERYRYTGKRRRTAGRFAGCTPESDRTARFAPCRLHRWHEAGVIEIDGESDARQVATPEPC